MASKLEELEAAASSLPLAERARLVGRLLASLEQGDDEVEMAWVEEAEREFADMGEAHRP